MSDARRFCWRLRVAWVPALAAALLCAEPARADDDMAFFEKRVRPILVERCYACHSGTKNSGGLSLETRGGWQKGGDSGPALAPGKPDDSLFIDAINYRSLQMPPKDKGGPLTAAEIATLTEWVRRGAFDPRDSAVTLGGMSADVAKTWWAFQPLPEVTGPLAPETVDAFLETELLKKNLVPNGPADKRTLIRRVTYDLTGLPPTPEDVETFVTDRSPDAYARLVERLLASPQYGVQWGRHWLDLVRYADTAGENTDRPLPHAWRYRNWVIDAFNRDLPYDEFLRLQLAGDLQRAGASPESFAEGVVATGYLAIARRFGHDIDKDVHLTHEDVIDNLGRSFLGLSLACARCHDHKFDPITTQDYYALSGIFQSTRFAFPGCEPKGQPRDLVPLLPQAEVDALLNPWRERTARADAERKRREEIESAVRNRAKEAASQATRLLASASVGEGASVPLLGADGLPLGRVAVRKGEVLQLVVLPNDNHGADSTLVEWSLREVGGEERTWSLADVVPQLSKANPARTAHGGLWCHLEVTGGPAFLRDRQESVQGRGELKAWSFGDVPSVFANTAAEPVAVWTTLPAKSFFVHPGPARPVAVAWISPIDGTVAISGRVADAHPAGLDGVAFRLEHVASPECGAGLLELARELTLPPIPVEPSPYVPVAYAVVDTMSRDARLHLRGDPEKLGEEVPRRWLSVFGGSPVPAESGSGRKSLGDWIAGHPLAARVMVNRLWEWHFGAGLVRTSSDFGSRGERPTHPELLDQLAAEFVAGQYSLKALHRLIVHTAAYQRSSARPEALLDADPDNRLFGRFARRRVTAEELRDSLLQAAGKLDLQPGGPHPFPAEETWTFTQHTPFTAVYETNMRSAYLMVQRQRRHPFLALFDGADPNSSTSARQTTTVPTQALYFLNDPFFHAQAAGLAGRLAKLPDHETRIAHLYRVALQRSPSTEERLQSLQFVSGYGASASEAWAALARVLLAGNEFLHVD